MPVDVSATMHADYVRITILQRTLRSTMNPSASSFAYSPFLLAYPVDSQAQRKGVRKLARNDTLMGNGVVGSSCLVSLSDSGFVGVQSGRQMTNISPIRSVGTIDLGDDASMQVPRYNRCATMREAQNFTPAYRYGFFVLDRLAGFVTPQHPSISHVNPAQSSIFS